MTVTHPLADIQLQFEKAFDAIGSGLYNMRKQPGEASEAGIWHPGLTIERSDSAYVVRVETVGISPDRIRFDIRDGFLEIGTGEDEVMEQPRGVEDLIEESNYTDREKRLLQEPEEGKYYVSSEFDEANYNFFDEFGNYGDYLARVPLPANVDIDGSVADRNANELVLRMPKK